MDQVDPRSEAVSPCRDIKRRFSGCLHDEQLPDGSPAELRNAVHYQAITSCDWFLNGSSGRCVLVAKQTVQQDISH